MEQNDRRLEMKPSSTSEHLLGAENGDVFNIILSPEKSVLDSRTLDRDGFHEHQEGFPCHFVDVLN